MATAASIGHWCPNPSTAGPILRAMDAVLSNGRRDYAVRFAEFAELALDTIDRQLQRLEARGPDPELARTLLSFAREVELLASEPGNAPAHRLAPRASATVARLVAYLAAAAEDSGR
jgi:hypothetical protein